MNGLSEVLKRRRKELGLTLNQIAEMMGVTEATVQRWESGNIKSVRHEKVVRLAEILKVNPASIMGWGDVNTTLPKGATPVDPATMHRIPILGRISAGLPLYAEQNVEGYTLTDLNGGAEYFALQVCGDSMNAARIEDGDVIIVRRQDEVENGELAVVMVGDSDATVKRLYFTGTTVTLMPQSTNPIHQPQIYDLQRTSIKVLGKVVKIEVVAK